MARGRRSKAREVSLRPGADTSEIVRLARCTRSAVECGAQRRFGSVTPPFDPVTEGAEVEPPVGRCTVPVNHNPKRRCARVSDHQPSAIALVCVHGRAAAIRGAPAEKDGSTGRRGCGSPAPPRITRPACHRANDVPPALVRNSLENAPRSARLSPVGVGHGVVVLSPGAKAPQRRGTLWRSARRFFPGAAPTVILPPNLSWDSRRKHSFWAWSLPRLVAWPFARSASRSASSETGRL
jgi:hypothetical protein